MFCVHTIATRIDLSAAREYDVSTPHREATMNTVKTQVIKIGNSRGIRIPKLLIDQVKLGAEVEILVQRDQLIIRPTSRPRCGWDEQFRAMAEHGDDRLLDHPVLTQWDKREWTW